MHVERDAMLRGYFTPRLEGVALQGRHRIAHLRGIAAPSGMAFAVALKIIGADAAEKLVECRLDRMLADVAVFGRRVKIKMETEKTFGAGKAGAGRWCIYVTHKIKPNGCSKRGGKPLTARLSKLFDVGRAKLVTGGLSNPTIAVSYYYVDARMEHSAARLAMRGIGPPF